jgi:hypothetical protein
MLVTGIKRGMRMWEISMVRHRVAPAVAAACLAAIAVSSARAEPRAVVELFTSQGCSSCPAADKLLGDLSRDRSLIALTLAVDYWDYLGWKDTLASTGHTHRQRAYAKARGDREVYTPQVVVNGVAHALGSDKTAIERAIQHTRQSATPLTLPVMLAVEGDKLKVSMPAKGDGAQGPNQGEVWLCPISKAVPVQIGRGENRGRMVTYSNVVRRWIKLGDWTGKAETFTVPLASLQSGEIDSVAVLVQNGATSSPKLMLGAAQASIR